MLCATFHSKWVIPRVLKEYLCMNDFLFLIAKKCYIIISSSQQKFLSLIQKLINYSRGYKPISVLHFGHMMDLETPESPLKSTLKCISKDFEIFSRYSRE